MVASLLALLPVLVPLTARARVCSTGSVSTADAPESWRTYSSIWGNDTAGAGSALDAAWAWSPRNDAAGQWMQMDLGAPATVSGVVVQGRADRDQWVTSYRVATSLDGERWEDVRGNFTGSRDRSSKVEGILPSPRLARYVRVEPLEWHGHVSMRAAALTCTAADVPGEVETPERRAADETAAGRTAPSAADETGRTTPGATPPGAAEAAPRGVCGPTPTNSCGGQPSWMCVLDPTCLANAGPGCNAGGVSQMCRYCGVGGGTPACPGRRLSLRGSADRG